MECTVMRLSLPIANNELFLILPFELSSETLLSIITSRLYTNLEDLKFLTITNVVGLYV
jgi:hypothetical protein